MDYFTAEETASDLAGTEAADYQPYRVVLNDLQTVLTDNGYALSAVLTADEWTDLLINR